MLFPMSEYVDDVWEEVAVGTAERQFGIAAKVSTADEEIGKERKLTWLVCVYTKDFTDRGDVKRVIMKLVELGLVGEERPVYYPIWWPCGLFFCPGPHRLKF
jgi:hypothetical protein